MATNIETRDDTPKLAPNKPEPKESVVESSDLLGGFLTAAETLRAGYVLAMKLMQSDTSLDEEEHNACYIFTHDRDGKPTIHDADATS